MFYSRSPASDHLTVIYKKSLVNDHMNLTQPPLAVQLPATLQCQLKTYHFISAVGDHQLTDVLYSQP